MVDLAAVKAGQSIEGLLEFSILNLDKPAGPTSFSVSHRVGKLLGLKKTCHFGTLDPMVTGVLPVGLARACRLAQFFIGRDKHYLGGMKLHRDVTGENLAAAVKRLTGRITQLPPVKSRVKRVPRQRTVYRWEILEFDRERREARFTAEVEAGTYVRKMVHDLGLEIGGAHLLDLRRTSAGIFSETDPEFIVFPELERLIREYRQGNPRPLQKVLIPGEVVSRVMPVVRVVEDKNIRMKLYHGGRLTADALSEIPGYERERRIAVFYRHRFIGVYRVTGQAPDFSARPEFVLQPMQAGQNRESESIFTA